MDHEFEVSLGCTVSQKGKISKLGLGLLHISKYPPWQTVSAGDTGQHWSLGTVFLGGRKLAAGACPSLQLEEDPGTVPQRPLFTPIKGGQ